LIRDGLEIRFHEDVTFPPAALDSLAKTHGKNFSFLPGPPFGMRYEDPPEDVLVWAKKFLSSLG
jgi:hypothetical protein